MRFTDRRSGRDFAKDPAVIFFKGQYWLYYSADATSEERERGISLMIGIAVSQDMEQWQTIGVVPITQPCEHKGIGAPAAIVLAGRVHLFYQAYGNWRNDALCHATSEDGIHFQKDETNPIFHPSTQWCSGRAIDADVCPIGDKLMLYFATRDQEMKIQMLGVASAPLSSDFSRDCWKQEAEHPILYPDLAWEGECIEAPAALYEDDHVYLFYGGSYNCTPQQIGCAVSEDGIHFTRIAQEPFLPCGQPGSWNQSESGHPYIFRDEDGEVYLFYQGSADGGKTWYLTRTTLCFKQGKPEIKTC